MCGFVGDPLAFIVVLVFLIAAVAIILYDEYVGIQK